MFHEERYDTPGIGIAYVVLVSLEALGLIILAIVALALEDTEEVEFIGAVGIFVSICFVLLSLSAILLENVFEFYGSLVNSFLITLYVVYHYASQTLGETFEEASLYVMIMVLVFQMVYIFMAPFIHQAFGWRIYKRVGSDPHLQEMYKTAEIFFSLLKIDLEFAILLVMLASFFLFESKMEIALNVGAIIVSLMWATVGFLSVRREVVSGMVLFLLFACIEPAYIIYQLIELYDADEEEISDGTNQFWITCSLALVVRLLLLIWMAFVWSNFGKGLRQRVFGKKPHHHHQAVSGHAAPLLH